MAYSHDQHGLSWIVMDCHGLLSLIVLDCHGLSCTVVMDCLKLSWTILDWISTIWVLKIFLMQAVFPPRVTMGLSVAIMTTIKICFILIKIIMKMHLKVLTVMMITKKKKLNAASLIKVRKDKTLMSPNSFCVVNTNLVHGSRLLFLLWQLQASTWTPCT